MSFDTIPLKRVARIRNSNVDKLISDDEVPVRLCNYVDVYYNDSITPALNLSVGSATKIEIERFHLKEGDVVITKDSETPSDIAIPAIVRKSGPKLVCGYHLAILKAAPDKLEGVYLFYALKSKPLAAYFETSAQGITRYGLTINGIGMAPIPIPPLPTQRTIADFLDRETARIDQLIQKKERLVELLEEKRLAQTEELLKGDRSTVSRIKFGICKIEQGWSPLCEERAVEGDSWGVLKLGAITGRCFDELNHKALPEGVAPRIVYQVKKGDVLIARASGSPALVGRACFVDSISKNLLISDKHYRVRFFNHSFDPRYFVFLLNSRLCREQIETQLSSAEGMARNIGQGVIRNLRTAVPAYTKQKEIANLITEQSRLIANTQEKVVASITRLREFRSALITAAVTGQIDVDEWSRRGGTDARLDAIAQEMEARTG